MERLGLNIKVEFKYHDQIKAPFKWTDTGLNMTFIKNMIDKRNLRKLNSTLVAIVDGIKISSFRPNDALFALNIRLILELIKDLDAKRYKRVCDCISWIVNSHITPKCEAVYLDRPKVCHVNYNIFHDNQDLVNAYYAGVIVHEATHGLLHAKGVDSSPDNRLQIERICMAEQNRFLRKEGHKYPEYSREWLIQEKFDPSGWDQHFKISLFKKYYRLWLRCYEEVNKQHN